MPLRSPLLRPAPWFTACAMLLLTGCVPAPGPPCASEAECYPLLTIPVPDDIALEVGGLEVLPGDRLAIATRRGDVWLVDGAADTSAVPSYGLFARGLHEPLGLVFKEGAYYTAQRGELTRLVDADDDGRADRYETVYRWPLSGNYHEYSYGPVVLPDDSFYVTLNVAWVGHGSSPVPWRGWALKIAEDGGMRPFAAGMRSPAGLAATSDGALFYAENQGDWIGSGYITHIERGDFGGHRNSLAWADRPESPVRLRLDDIPDTGRPRHVVGAGLPGFKLPTVWFPHTLMGISTAHIIEDTNEGLFGPFAGQLFVSDQGHSKIMRVSLERVDGVLQGACYPFREGLMSGPIRMDWGSDGSLYVGMTSRGWASTGPEPYGLQRLVWSGKVPFEILAVRAEPDGFTLDFTRPVIPSTAADPARYEVTGFTYRYHSTYGSDPIGRRTHPVRSVEVTPDGRSARLVVDGLRAGYIHEIRADTLLRSREGLSLLHGTAYYTLNRIPGGEPPAGAPAPPPAAEGASTQVASVDSALKRVTEQPAEWTEGPDRTVVIGTLPGLRFDTEAFEVEAGSRVRLEFRNTDDMLHNLLVVAPGTIERVGQDAMNMGLRGPEMNYVPASDDVLFHTALLQPETTESIYFTVPDEPGEYAFVCTFPGHYYTMRGVMRVVAPSA